MLPSQPVYVQSNVNAPEFWPSAGTWLPAEMLQTVIPVSAPSMPVQVTGSSQSSSTSTSLLSSVGREEKVPRPPNSFMLYRKEKQALLRSTDGSLTNTVISKRVGEMWANESEEVKDAFASLAQAAKEEHALRHPNYKFMPRRSKPKRTMSQAPEKQSRRAAPIQRDVGKRAPSRDGLPAGVSVPNPPSHVPLALASGNPPDLRLPSIVYQPIYPPQQPPHSQPPGGYFVYSLGQPDDSGQTILVHPEQVAYSLVPPPHANVPFRGKFFACASFIELL